LKIKNDEKKSANACRVNLLYVILSGENRKAVCEVEVLRVERSEQAKPRSERDAGIWQRVWVAFVSM
jgi:hypothetical protein